MSITQRLTGSLTLMNYLVLEHALYEYLLNNAKVVYQSPDFKPLKHPFEANASDYENLNLGMLIDISMLDIKVIKKQVIALRKLFATESKGAYNSGAQTCLPSRFPFFFEEKVSKSVEPKIDSASICFNKAYVSTEIKNIGRGGYLIGKTDQKQQKDLFRQGAPFLVKDDGLTYINKQWLVSEFGKASKIRQATGTEYKINLDTDMGKVTMNIGSGIILFNQGFEASLNPSWDKDPESDLYQAINGLSGVEVNTIDEISKQVAQKASERPKISRKSTARLIKEGFHQEHGLYEFSEEILDRLFSKKNRRVLSRRQRTLLGNTFKTSAGWRELLLTHYVSKYFAREFIKALSTFEGDKTLEDSLNFINDNLEDFNHADSYLNIRSYSIKKDGYDINDVNTVKIDTAFNLKLRKKPTTNKDELEIMSIQEHLIYRCQNTSNWRETFDFCTFNGKDKGLIKKALKKALTAYIGKDNRLKDIVIEVARENGMQIKLLNSLIKAFLPAGYALQKMRSKRSTQNTLHDYSDFSL